MNASALILDDRRHPFAGRRPLLQGPDQIFDILFFMDIRHAGKLKGSLNAGIHTGSTKKTAGAVEYGLYVAPPASGSLKARLL
jgi:hypothetical protein